MFRSQMRVISDSNSEQTQRRVEQHLLRTDKINSPEHEPLACKRKVPRFTDNHIILFLLNVPGNVCSGHFKTLATFLKHCAFLPFQVLQTKAWYSALSGIFHDHISVTGYFCVCKRMEFDRVLTFSLQDVLILKKLVTSNHAEPVQVQQSFPEKPLNPSVFTRMHSSGFYLYCFPWTWYSENRQEKSP